MNNKSNHKILIVDDQQKNIQVLGSLLRQENYIIGVAMNGKQALDILVDSNDYDLVLLDVNMPIMDGFETCKAIRKHKDLKETPIIFLTALVEPDDIVMGFEVGGQDYVTKPFNSSELLARVNTQLELKGSKDKLKKVNQFLESMVEERTKELIAANSQLLNLDSAKSDFLKIISHEIRTPLNGIIGILGIINDYELPEEVKNWLELMETSANRLENLSLKALDISLFNSRLKNLLKLNSADIIEIIIKNIDSHKEPADAKGITILLQNNSKDTHSFLDASYINKCFSYIIDNAIKFGDKDSQIHIKITDSNNNHVITFEDTGEKLPEDFDISQLKPFDNDAHVDENPGLSLFLCKQIIEAHNGKIEMEDTPESVVVTVSIPKVQVN